MAPGGNGGGKEKDTTPPPEFRIQSLSDGTISGTGDPTVEVIVEITAEDNTVFEGTATWNGETWSYNLSGATNVNNSADTFGDESGSFTVTAYYLDGKGKNQTKVYASETVRIIDEDTNITLSAADSDPEITLTGDPSNGSVVVNADGTITYTPDPDYYGNDSFSYSVNGIEETVFLEVRNVNDAPAAGDDDVTTDEDISITIYVLANDSDAENDALTVTITSDPSNGSAIVNADGTITYTPNENYNGSDKLTYQVDDGNGGTATATVNLTVNPENDAPVANDDSAETEANTPVTIDVLANDFDLDGDSLTVSILTGPGKGGAVVNDNGTITYTPNENYNGLDALTYQVDDGNGGTSTATVNLTVGNRAPVANDDFYVTDEDVQIEIRLSDLMLNDSDPDGDFFGILELITENSTGEGTLTPSQADPSGTFIFTPDANWNGTATFEYTLTDGFLTSNVATVTITVNPVADAPIAADDVVTTEYDTEVIIDVMSNDFDPDTGADPGADGTINVTSVTDPSHGSVVLNQDGTVTYTPKPGYEGSDSFTYELSDADGDTSTGTVNITVKPEVDTTPPPVSAPDLIAGSDSGFFDDDNITNDTTPTLTGTSEAGATIEISDGSTLLGSTTADGNGIWSLTVALADGTHQLTAVATDDAENASAPSSALQVVIDTGADTPQVAEVLNSDGSVAAGGVTDDKTPTLRGTTEPYARVTISVNSTVVAVDVIADGSGLWEYTLDPSQELLDDIYSVTVQATDLAGNVSATSQSFHMEVDAVEDPTSPPPPPSGESYSPGDPLYDQQWHLRAIGDIEAIWAEFTGAGTLVGIYDNGVEATHEDLGNYDTNYELAGGGTKEHGTAVAGVIAASDNDVGVVGVAFGATLGGANIFDGTADINNNPSGYKAVIDQADMFDVISLSWGNGPDWINNDAQQSIDSVNAFAAAALTGRDGRGTSTVKAAGNDYGNSGGDWINHSRHAIVVGAHDSGDASTGLAPDASWYTNRGPNVLVSAPSSGSLDSGNLAIMTTDETGSAGYNTVGDYTGTGTSGFGGTSSATPVVSGAVALMLDANPLLGWRDIQEILAYSSEKIEGDPGATDTIPIIWMGMFIVGYEEYAAEYHNWYENDAYNWNGGGLHFNEDYGFGKLNVYNAVRMAEAWSLFWSSSTVSSDPTAVETSLNELTVSSGVQAGGENTIGTEFQTPLSVYFNYDGPEMSLEHIDLDITWTADQRENVTMELISPSQTTATLVLSAGDAGGVEGTKSTNSMPFGAGTIDWTFGARSFMGEDPTGTWEIRLTDEVWSSFGALYDFLRIDEFELTFYGEAVDPELPRSDTYHYTMEMLDPTYSGDANRVSLSDLDGSDDWIDMAAMSTNLLINLQDSASSFSDYQGADQVQIVSLETGTVIEHAVAGDGNDQVVGNGEHNRLAGMRGDDTLEGGAGNDSLLGFYGNDELWGGDGDDWFFFEVNHGDDWIGDFIQGSDTVALNGFAETSFSDIAGSFSVSGSDQVLTFASGDSITFAGASGVTFAASDFAFGTEFI